MSTVGLLIILILLLDVTVLWNIKRSNCTQGYKILYALIIFLFPIVGVSIYYMIRK